jgi:cytochrome b pre-mRNA-processing protein 3
MSFLFGRRRAANEAQITGERLHDELVAAIRRPVYYLQFDVPDTFEGRFDLLVLHVGIVLRRLGEQGSRGEPVAQSLVDTLFSRLDIAMRELGVSDIGVPKRMKRYAQAFRGRVAAYQSALAADDSAALAEAIGRNVLDGRNGSDLARYALRFDSLLAGLDLAASDSHLPPIPEPVEA